MIALMISASEKFNFEDMALSIAILDALASPLAILSKAEKKKKDV